MSSNKKTVAFVTPRMIIGGAESYIITKAYWLINKGYNVVVFSLGGENVANLPVGCNHYVFDGIDDSPLHFTSKAYKSFIQNLSDVLVDNHVDIIEAHNTFPIFHVAMSYKQTGIPFLANILHELAYVKNPLLAILTRKLNRFGLYYTLTSEMNTYIENSFHSKLNPIILPIPVKGIISKNDKIAEPYILSVCRLSEDKMYVKYLIRDFYNLYLNNDFAKSYRLIIVGDGELYGEMLDLAEKFNDKAQSNIIELKGTIVGEDLDLLYQNCEVFVGMGISLLLAASCGKPSIIAGFTKESESYSWGYWGENPLDSNVIGISTAKDRVKTSFESAIKHLIESRESYIIAGNVARKMFSENYDLELIMSEWEREYHRVIRISSDCAELKKELRFSFIITFLRNLRYIYKAIFKN